MRQRLSDFKERMGDITELVGDIQGQITDLHRTHHELRGDVRQGLVEARRAIGGMRDGYLGLLLLAILGLLAKLLIPGA